MSFCHSCWNFMCRDYERSKKDKWNKILINQNKLNSNFQHLAFINTLLFTSLQSIFSIGAA